MRKQKHNQCGKQALCSREKQFKLTIGLSQSRYITWYIKSV